MKPELEDLLSLLDSSDLLNNCQGAMVTGSYAEGNQTLSSDIDILLVSKNKARISSDHLKLNSRTLHLTYLPYHKIYSILKKQWIESDFVYASMISKGIIIKDDNTYIMKRLRSSVRNQKKPDNEYLLIQLKSQFQDALNDFVEADAFNAKIYCASDLLRIAPQLIATYKHHTGKHIARLSGQQLNDEFIQSYIRFITEKNETNFIKYCEKLLDAWGGSIEERSSNKVTSSSSENIILYIRGVKIEDRDLFKRLRFFFEQNDNLKYYIFYEGSHQIFSEGIYILFENNDSLYEKLMVLQKENLSYCQDNNIQICFPYSSILSGRFIYNNSKDKSTITPYLQQISRWIFAQQDFLNDTDYRNLRFCIAYLFLLELLKNNHEELDVLLDFFSTEFLDHNGIYNENQVLRLKPSVQQHYSNYFAAYQLDRGLNQSEDLKPIAVTLEILTEEITRRYKFQPALDNRYLNIVSHCLSVMLLHPLDKFYVVIALKSTLSKNEI